MKECTACNQVKTNFSPQKTRPFLMYSWCDDCRENPPIVLRRKEKRKSSFYDEINELRKKAKSFRVLDDAQVVEVKKEYHSGTHVNDLALKYGISKKTIYKYIKA